MLTANVSKPRKMSCTTLHLFQTYFQKMRLFLSEWAYYVRSKNKVKKHVFILTRLRVHAQRCVNVLRRKFLLYGTTHLYCHRKLTTF